MCAPAGLQGVHTLTNHHPRGWLPHSLPRPQVDGFAFCTSLCAVARCNWTEPIDPSIGADFNFAVTPDANFYMLAGLFNTHVDHVAVKWLLRHLKT